MKKKWMILFLLVSCLLCSCAGEEKETFGSDLTSTVTLNDFIFTLTAEKTVYTEEEAAGEEDPFSYKLEMEYTGEERIRIWHAGSIGTIAVWNGEKVFYSVDIEMELMHSYLERNDRITIDEWTGEIWTGEPMLEEQKLVPGIYTVTGYIDFQVGEEYEDVNHLKDNDNIDCSLSLPLVIQ